MHGGFRGRHLFHGGLEARLRETFIEIPGQNVVSIRCHVEFRIGLARCRSDYAQQLVLAERVIAFDRERCDARLLPFLDPKTNEEVALLSLVIIERLRFHLGVLEPVGEIKTLHGLTVAFEQAAAETPARGEGVGQKLQASAKKLVAEVTVTGDFDADEVVPLAALDPVGDKLFRAWPGVCLPADFLLLGRVGYSGVEIGVAFELFEDVSPALFQQVGIHRALLVDGHKTSDLAVGQLGTGDHHAHQRALGNFQVERNRILFRNVFAAANGRPRAQVALLREKFAHAVASALKPRRCDFLAGLQPGARDEFAVGILRVIDQLNRAGARAPAGLDVHDNIHLQRIGVRNRFRRKLRVIETLFPEGVLQSHQRFVEQLFSIRLTKINLHRRGGAGLAGRRDETFKTNLVEEEIFTHYEIQTHAAGQLREDSLQVGVVAGAIELTQDFPQRRRIERLADANGEALRRFGENAPVLRHDANGDHRAVCESRGLRRFRSLRANAAASPRKGEREKRQTHSVAAFHAFKGSDEG